MISFSVRNSVEYTIVHPPSHVGFVHAPESRPEPARQLTFDLGQPRVENPTVLQVDLLIQTTLAGCQPYLELPSVRVAGRMRRTLGSYTPSQKQIAISSRLLAMGDEADIRQVVLHEVAHAIVHARHGEKTSAHGREFRAVCDEMGIKPRRHVDVSTEKWQSRVRFLSKCGYCKVIIVRKRRMRSVRCGCGVKVYPKSWRAAAPAERDANGDWVAL
ncbi:MAG: SprT-like domain-containing protein [Chloroflexi bacterium]|nr:SprT-like domain-containing protein [Chloroflexota bacterium]